MSENGEGNYTIILDDFYEIAHDRNSFLNPIFSPRKGNHSLSLNIAVSK